MKKWDVRDIIIAILAVIIIVVAFMQENRIDRLERQYSNLKEDTSFKIDMLMEQVDRLSLTVNQLQEEATMIKDIQYQFGQLYADRATIDVQVTVIPKTIEEGMKAYVSLWGVETPLTRDGNTFVGIVPVDLFLTDGERPLLVLATDHREETEWLPEFSTHSLWEKYLPSLGVDVTNASVSSGENDSNLKLEAHGTLQIVEAETGVSFTKIAMVAQINGKEILREDITQKVISSDTYQENGTYESVFELYPEGTLGDEVVMYVEAIDEYGFVHECSLVHHRYAADGTIKWSGYDESIYDPQGYLRFGPGKARY